MENIQLKREKRRNIGWASHNTRRGDKAPLMPIKPEEGAKGTSVVRIVKPGRGRYVSNSSYWHSGDAEEVRSTDLDHPVRLQSGETGKKKHRMGRRTSTRAQTKVQDSVPRSFDFFFRRQRGRDEGHESARRTAGGRRCALGQGCLSPHIDDNMSRNSFSTCLPLDHVSPDF